jgi:hypothetical protein
MKILICFNNTRGIELWNIAYPYVALNRYITRASRLRLTILIEIKLENHFIHSRSLYPTSYCIVKYFNFKSLQNVRDRASDVISTVGILLDQNSKNLQNVCDRSPSRASGVSFD